jgi:hypothetical protein
MISVAPTYGVLIRCVLEEDPNEGRTVWLDLKEVEDEEHIQFEIDCITGRTNDPYPESWINEGTFEVAQISGLGPRLAAIASDADGPLIESLADLATALQMLKPEEVAPFLAWAESSGDSWLPGYGIHPPEDAVEMYRIRNLP